MEAGTVRVTVGGTILELSEEEALELSVLLEMAVEAARGAGATGNQVDAADAVNQVAGSSECGSECSSEPCSASPSVTPIDPQANGHAGDCTDCSGNTRTYLNPIVLTLPWWLYGSYALSLDRQGRVIYPRVNRPW